MRTKLARIGYMGTSREATPIDYQNSTSAASTGGSWFGDLLGSVVDIFKNSAPYIPNAGQNSGSGQYLPPPPPSQSSIFDNPVGLVIMVGSGIALLKLLKK